MGSVITKTLTSEEIARILQLHRKTVQRLLRDGEIRSVWIGGYRVLPEWLEDYINRKATGRS